MTSARDYRERLIDEVKKYPVLYDTRHENHRDIDVRDRCWNEISERIGANCEVLKKEWKILRDSLRQSIKKGDKGETTKAGLPCKQWRFQKRMSFVMPYMTKRNQRLMMKGSVKTDMESEAMSDAEDPEVWEPSPAADGAGAEAGEVVEGQEALELFFASVCQSCKRLTPGLQRQVKKQVLDVLLRAEEQMDNQVENKDVLYKNF